MKQSLPQRIAHGYASLIVRHPVAVLLILSTLALGSGWAASKLTINSNQLDLISQDLRQVQDVKRVVDMVGGAGHLMLALRGDDPKLLKATADELAKRLEADKANVRTLSYRLPVEFIQEKYVLFIKTEDLVEGKRRINEYIQAKLRENNPFNIGLVKREEAKLEMGDLISKYSSVGKKSIADDYNISPDGRMIMMLIKPMWEGTEIEKTKVYVEKLRGDLAAFNKDNPVGVTLEESYDPESGRGKTVTFGFSGNYKMSLDDADSIKQSLGPVTFLSLFSIAFILLVYFRKPFAVLLVAAGMAAGALFTYAFAYVTVGELNMITSILAAILMGLGEDFGVHFVTRTRLEFGEGKGPTEALQSALEHDGVPAFISAIATSGAFYALMFSEFRGFSQFGLLAGFGIVITGLVLLSFKPALLVLIGRRWPHLPAKLIGVRAPVEGLDAQGHETRVPFTRPLLITSAVVLSLLTFVALPKPWAKGDSAPKDADLWTRISHGVQFDYNTRALLPDTQTAVKLQDEINKRFNISSDPIAVYTPTIEDTKKVYEAFQPLAEKQQPGGPFDTVDQVVSIFTFVPPPDVAERNAKVLAEWREELKDIDQSSLPPDLQERAGLFFRMLDARPYTVEGLPRHYIDQFRELPTTKPENKGFLTFIYPGVDLYEGKRMMAFAAQVEDLKTADGQVFHGAGLPILFAKLADIVLFDARLTVGLTALWIFAVLWLDFKKLKYALAALLPLGLGMFAMMGLMTLFNIRLNFMNIVVLPVVLGYGVSHGVYLMHRFLEGTSPMVALKSVGAAVFFSTLTTVAGFAALIAADHNGLRSMGTLASLGLLTTLAVSFTLLAAVLQVMHDRRASSGTGGSAPAPQGRDTDSAAA
jgi:predicted RND superfamily exporter protein